MSERAWVPHAIAVVLLAALAPAQSRIVHPTQTFAFTAPPGWRQLTPDEALALSKRPGNEIPADLLSPKRADAYAYGAIDRWLAGSFDGRCMIVEQVDGECPVDETGIEQVRASGAHTEERWSREVISLETTTVGTDALPAIEGLFRTTVQDAARTLDSLVLFVPTGGNTLILTFRTSSDDFAAALPEFRAIAASLTFAQRPHGTPDPGSRVFYPLLVGAFVVVLLLVLRRRPPRPDEN